MSGVLGDWTSQLVFHDGMVSPLPLDDVMFTPPAGFQLPDHDLDTNHDMGIEKIATNGLMGAQSVAGSEMYPISPSSLSQASVYAVEDPVGSGEYQSLVSARSSASPGQQNSQLSSILDRPKQSSDKFKSRDAANGSQDKVVKRQRRGSNVNQLAANGANKSDSKDRSREKNKVAAAKCRAKKRDHMDLIETSHRTLSSENSLLRRQEQQLRATVAGLRTLALDHQNCTCGVHQYNMAEARKLAHGLGGLCSISGLRSGNTTNVEPPKEQSCPVDNVSPGHASFHSISQSFPESGAFASPLADGYLQMHDPVFGGEQGFLEYDPSLNDQKFDVQRCL